MENCSSCRKPFTNNQAEISKILNFICGTLLSLRKTALPSHTTHLGIPGMRSPVAPCWDDVVTVVGRPNSLLINECVSIEILLNIRCTHQLLTRTSWELTASCPACSLGSSTSCAVQIFDFQSLIHTHTRSCPIPLKLHLKNLRERA